ncbi:MAG: hypothetical protein ACR2PH_02040 [Desulfobulbia bacterium]
MYSDDNMGALSSPKCVERNFERDIERHREVLVAQKAVKTSLENLKNICGLRGDGDYRRSFFMIYGDITMAVVDYKKRIDSLIKEQEAYIKRNTKK